MSQKDDDSNPNVSLNEDGKNASNAYCKIKNCNSLVFRSNCAPLAKIEQILPVGRGEEKVTNFWRFDDIFQFDNITFTKEAETPNGKIKYLACCDCEHGPIGFQNLDTKICYVAVDRVCYKNG